MVLPTIRQTGKYETQPPVASPPMSDEVKFQRTELLLHAAELETHDLAEQQRLVDLAVVDLVDQCVSVPISPTIPNRMLSDLPERIGLIKNAGEKQCGGVTVPLYILSDVAEMTGATAAEFDRFADKYRLKAALNGEWVRVPTPQGDVREFLYTMDAVRIFQKGGK